MKGIYISLRAAISLITSDYIEGELNTFGLKYYKTNGEASEKRLACRVDLKKEPSEKEEFKTKEAKRPGTQTGKTGFRYSVYKTRVLKLYDMDNEQHFSIKVDLLTHLYHHGNIYIVDHVLE